MEGGMADEFQIGRWMIAAPAKSDEVNLRDSQSQELIAIVHGKSFEEKLQRAMLIQTSPNLQDVTRAAYWLFKFLSEQDPRVAEAAEEFLPCMESALHSIGGVGENPLRQ
jgi:hypothetical protein